MTEKLKFNDGINIGDKTSQPSSGMGLKGKVKVMDEFGNTILEKDNLIVLRGRTYALERLFGKPIDAEASGYRVNLNRSICLFKVGSGGADIESAPFQPFAPLYSDEDLAKPVPFVVQDPAKHETPEKENNPSIIEELSEEQRKRYYLPEVRSDGTTEYYGKVFEVEPQWVFSKENNEVYQKIMLKINADETRGYLINELGLVFAEYDEANNTYKDTELFSRVTFDSESLTSLTKTVLIEYLIYA
ncbi:hypothetical protein Goe21_02790 [Bacillus phage vB_BsuM-Goe21]|nr:hypothetical protein Goe21_02790 [Bacillus phage vB_BsuM-Goe21]